MHRTGIGRKRKLLVCTDNALRFYAQEAVLLSQRLYFLLKEQPSVNLALPPDGVHNTEEQPSQATAVWAWEKTVEMFKHPGHLTSIKKDLGACTKVFNLCFWASEAGLGCNKS